MSAAMSEASRVRRLLRVAAVVIVLGAAIYAIEPFSVPVRGVAATGATAVHSIGIGGIDCGAPLRSAWRSDGSSSGWFGYAPLTSVPVLTASHLGCGDASRRRLEVSFAGVVLALGIGHVARRAGRTADAGT